MSSNIDLRDRLGKSQSKEEFRAITLEMRNRLVALEEQEKDDEIRAGTKYSMNPDFPDLRSLPPWICQPLVRAVKTHEKNLRKETEKNDDKVETSNAEVLNVEPSNAEVLDVEPSKVETSNAETSNVFVHQIGTKRSALIEDEILQNKRMK
jgi:hypothetical protein